MSNARCNVSFLQFWHSLQWCDTVVWALGPRQVGQPQRPQAFIFMILRYQMCSFNGLRGQPVHIVMSRPNHLFYTTLINVSYKCTGKTSVPWNHTLGMSVIIHWSCWSVTIGRTVECWPSDQGMWLSVTRHASLGRAQTYAQFSVPTVFEQYCCSGMCSGSLSHKWEPGNTQRKLLYLDHLCAGCMLCEGIEKVLVWTGVPGVIICKALWARLRNTEKVLLII